MKVGANKLYIGFYSPINKVLPTYDCIPYQVPISNNDQTENRLSVFTRKAGYHYGWDWGPRLVTSGIWRPVTVHAWNTATIDDLFIKQLRIEGNSANLEAEVTTSSTEQRVKTLSVFKDGETTPVLQKDILVEKGTSTLKKRANYIPQDNFVPRITKS